MVRVCLATRGPTLVAPPARTWAAASDSEGISAAIAPPKRPRPPGGCANLRLHPAPRGRPDSLVPHARYQEIKTAKMWGPLARCSSLLIIASCWAGDPRSISYQIHSNNDLNAWPNLLKKVRQGQQRTVGFYPNLYKSSCRIPSVVPFNFPTN